MTTLATLVHQALVSLTPEAKEHYIREAYDAATTAGRDDLADALGSLLYTDLLAADPHEALIQIQQSI